MSAASIAGRKQARRTIQSEEESPSSRAGRASGNGFDPGRRRRTAAMIVPDAIHEPEHEKKATDEMVGIIGAEPRSEGRTSCFSYRRDPIVDTNEKVRDLGSIACVLQADESRPHARSRWGACWRDLPEAREIGPMRADDPKPRGPCRTSPIDAGA